MLGALACYALILFNLIYGVATLARLKGLRPPIPSVNALEPQRPAGTATAVMPAGMPGIGNSFAAVAVPGLCRIDAAFESTRHVIRGHAVVW